MKLYDFSVQNHLGQHISLDKYKGKVVLIVNTAIHCGLAPQYQGLEKLYQTYHEKGLEILDFPCNQFGNQSPESDEETAQICEIKLKNSFKPFGKLNVNGPDTHPLYRWLKKGKAGLFGADIKWNFTKFLVDRQGRIVKRFSPVFQPAQLTSYIERLL
jgi:glutathione peroxidase